jgi:hypothetical protein
MLEIKNCVSFPEYLSLSKESVNKVGILVTVFQRLHPHAPKEDSENLGGRMARLWAETHKDTGYLVKIIWNTSSDNIAGSHLNYIQAIIKKTNIVNVTKQNQQPTTKLKRVN